MGKRPRRKSNLIGEVIVDGLEYAENIGSRKARKIIEKSEQLHVEVWYDKHYLNRVQFGDNGGRRSGIEEKVVSGAGFRFSISFDILFFSGQGILVCQFQKIYESFYKNSSSKGNRRRFA